MNRERAPGFRGTRALLIHRADEDGERIVRQLERLGCVVATVVPGETGAMNPHAHDVVLFDADLAHDGMFPWHEPPMPLIALLGSETPGRLELVLRAGVHAYLVKPVRSAGVYSAMVIAAHHFRAAGTLRARIAELEQKVRVRPIVFDALVRIMTATACDHLRAYELLRAAAMDQRVSVEELSLAISSGCETTLAKIRIAAQSRPRRARGD